MARQRNPWKRTGDELVAALALEKDPAKVAALVGIHIEQLRRELTRVSDIRVEAVAQMRDAGMSYEAIGDRIGLTRGRVAQIARESGRGGRSNRPAT